MLGSPVSAQCGLRGFRLYELVVGTRWTIARRVVIGWPSWSYEDQGYGGSIANTKQDKPLLIRLTCGGGRPPRGAHSVWIGIGLRVIIVA